MNVKILGVGCPKCQSMYSDVTRIIVRNQWKVDVEYVQDISQIMAYGILGTPALVIDEKVVMVGHRGARLIEQALQGALVMQEHDLQPQNNTHLA